MKEQQISITLPGVDPGSVRSAGQYAASAMTIERITTNHRMSKIVKHNGTAYLCGQVAKDRNGDIQTQVTGMLEKVDELLESIGSSRDKIRSATIYLADMADF